MYELTIEEKERKIGKLEQEIETIKNMPTRPYELVRVTFDGHGLRSDKRIKVLMTSKYKNELVTKCDELYGEFPQETPKKAKDRKYKTIYQVVPQNYYTSHLIKKVEKEEKPEKKVTLNFYHEGVQINTLDSLLRVYKTLGYTIEKVYERTDLTSDNPVYLNAKETIKNTYLTTKPYTKEEVIKLFNEEQLDAIGFPF